MTRPKEAILDVVELGTGKVISSVTVSDPSPNKLNRVEMGMLRNMNLERYGVIERKRTKVRKNK